MVIILHRTFFWVIVTALGIFMVAVKPTLSQDAPVFWITWSAESYSDPGYEGKALPTNNTLINVSFELIQNGKAVTISRDEVRWFLDESPVKDALGVKEFSFHSTISSGAHSLRIELPGFKGGSSLMKSIQIPVSSPEVILDAPYVKNAITSQDINLKALPYYFNVTQGGGLIWSWKVNNMSPEKAAGAPNKIKIEIPSGAPSGSQVFVKVKAVNSIIPDESAETLALFTTQ